MSAALSQVEREAARLVAAADPGRTNLYYSELRRSPDPASLAAAIAFSLDPFIQEARDDLERLIQLVDEARQRLARLEELGAAATAIATGELGDADVLLRGRAVGDKAIEIALAHGRRELHYTEWFELLRRDGFLVAGDKPLATFLTNLTRHPRIESAGARSGVYRIQEDAGVDG